MLHFVPYSFIFKIFSLEYIIEINRLILDVLNQESKASFIANGSFEAINSHVQPLSDKTRDRELVNLQVLY